ncbi:MAG: hypothetical protein PSV36_07480 [Algoriphagus sp.]|nr:hypothetical protein [Algoriphagus sp.]
MAKSFFILMFVIFQNSQTTLATVQNIQAENVFNPDKNDSISQIIIDPSVLNSGERNIFLEALTKLSLEKEYFKQIMIEPNQNILGIIKDEYSYSQKTNYDFTEYQKKNIKSINQLDDTFKIYAFDSILIPVIPILEYDSSNIDNQGKVNFFNISGKGGYIQNSFISNDSVNVFFKSNSLNFDIIEENVIDTVDYSNLIIYNLKKEDLIFLFNILPDSIIYQLQGKGYIVLDDEPIFEEIKFPSDSIKIEETPDPSFSNHLISIQEKVKNIEFSDFGTYYIVDFFSSDDCSHGNKVLSVVNQRLKELNLDSLKLKIVPVPINYFQNIDSSLFFLEKYYNSPSLSRLPKLEGNATIQKLKKLRNKNLQNYGNNIPEIFLDAVLKHLYGNTPDIISTSFYITTYRDIMPNFVNSQTNFITASLNEPGKKIEDLAERSQSLNGNILGAIQPLYSSYLNYAKTGTIIVGSKIRSSVFYGMSSINGEYISTLGKGIGWGNLESCLKPSEKGSSYSTPDVAITLFIAKAFWRMHDFFPNAIESRTRLIMCSDIEKDFIGKFASGGQPNLNKMLSIGTGFIEKSNGELIDCSEISGSIKFNNDSQLPIKRGREGISGITVIDDQVFAFFESSLSWKLIEINNLNIVYESSGKSYKISSLDEFKTSFKQIVKLKI